MIAATGVAAGWSLWNDEPHAVPLSRAALVLSAMRAMQSLFWTALPSNMVPGQQTLWLPLIIVHHGAWLIYLTRSRQVRSRAR